MNGTLIRRAVVVSLFLAVLVSPRAFAAARVFLSGTGIDAGDCSDAANPCRSLQYAIDQAAAGAEVVIVSSGGYGGATISKSITVNAPTGVIAFVGKTITVTIASSDTVTLRGLSMNGAVLGSLTNGIDFTAGGTLNVENTIISGFHQGIVDTAAGSKVWVHYCDVKNMYNGIYIYGASAIIENSRVVENSNIGVYAQVGSTVVVRNSVAQGNAVAGFLAQNATGGSTVLIVDSCVSTNNAYGLYSYQSAPGVATVRAGKNIVMNNATANLITFNGSSMISHGGNRIGGAAGGTTGFTGTEAQQ
ncbi:MAG: hypothetical protein DMF57_14475 [Acidobacteria bacterium]|nr:MAG: hypothetical protein DMF57_14475 [Acidobacteriota bacterium]